MARNFVAASSQYLSAGSSPVTGNVLTVSAWIRIPTIANNHSIISLSTSSVANRHVLYFIGGTNNMAMYSGNSGGTFGQALKSSALSAGVWAHVCGVVSATNSRQVYVNGVAGTANTTNVTGIAPDTTHIGAVSNAGSLVSGFYVDGQIADVRIWDGVALSADEISALADRGPQTGIRPESLAAAWDLIGRDDPEPDLLCVHPLTVTGATQYDHPPIIRRRKAQIFVPKVVSGLVSHATSGALSGGGSAIDGAAARMRAHAANGDLYGIGATIDGAAARTRLHPATGDIVGGGAIVTGDAIRVVIVSHDSSGAIIGGGAAIDGVAARTGTSEHASSGDLIGGGSSIDGAAARHRAMTASGDIVGGGADIAGIAAIVKTHVTSGDLFGEGAVITGVVIRGGQVDLLYVAINARAAFVCVVNERGAYSCVVTARNAYSCSVSEAIVR